MPKFIRLAAAPLVLLAFVAACQKSNDAPADARQVELAPAPAGQPQLADTAPAAPAAAPASAPAKAPEKAPAKAPTSTAAKPATPAPTPAPAAKPAVPTTGVVAAGSSLGVATGARVCTNTHKVGDQVSATVSAVANGSNGVSVPTGATVMLKVTQAVRGENGKEGIRLAFAPVSVTIGDNTYDVVGTASVGDLETVRAQTTGDQAKKVAAGAAVGAIAGQLLGKKTKSTVVGAAVGAAAGGAIAAGSADWNGCLPQGGRVNITLSEPLTIKRAP